MNSMNRCASIRRAVIGILGSVCLMCTSCDSSGGSSRFVGAWKSDVFKMVKDKNEKFEDQIASFVASGLVYAMEIESELTVSADGTFAMTTTGYVLGAKQAGVRTGTWKSNGNRLTLIEATNNATTFEMTGDKLIHKDQSGSMIVYKR